jgi:hypothetical protein
MYLITIRYKKELTMPTGPHPNKISDVYDSLFHFDFRRTGNYQNVAELFGNL